MAILTADKKEAYMSICFFFCIQKKVRQLPRYLCISTKNHDIAFST